MWHNIYIYKTKWHFCLYTHTHTQFNIDKILTTKHQTKKSRKQKHRFEHISTKKTQNPPKNIKPQQIVTINLNMKARKAKLILFGGLHSVSRLGLGVANDEWELQGGLDAVAASEDEGGT